MSPNLFCSLSLFFAVSFLPVVVQFAKGYCHSIGVFLAYYRALIVCLDCSSDIQQIKPGRRYTVMSRRVNKGKRRLMCRLLIMSLQPVSSR